MVVGGLTSETAKFFSYNVQPPRGICSINLVISKKKFLVLCIWNGKRMIRLFLMDRRQWVTRYGGGTYAKGEFE